MSQTGSKSQNVMKAAEARAKRAEEEATPGTAGRTNISPLPLANEETMVESANTLAETNVQSRANTLTGEIDPQAMGDVKGDGRDAKDYPDDDPDKQLGVPTYAAGLRNVTGGAVDAVQERRVIKRTEEEMSRGKDAITSAKSLRRSEARTAMETGTDTSGSTADGTKSAVEQGKASDDTRAKAEAKK